MNELSLRSLDCLAVGQSAVIAALPPCIELTRRLNSLGLVNGTWITVINRTPSGDAIACCFRKSLIALRRSDAEKIVVRIPDTGNDELS